MLEFSSVSASSYDPSALATKLTEKSAEGWHVVSIVNTGSDVTAFLSREGTGATASASDTPAVTAEASTETAATSWGQSSSYGETAAEPAATEPAAAEPAAAEPAAAEAAPAASSGGFSFLTPESSTTSEPAAAATAEPSGWGAAPDSADTSSYGGGASSYGDTAGASISPTLPGSGPTSYSLESNAAEAATQVQPEVAAVQPAQAAQPAASAVPAGWYADPAARFELRYWDGNTWTEHVSRAGQQFTDPPVA
jgi:Protein of unknown function (DUF2510)